MQQLFGRSRKSNSTNRGEEVGRGHRVAAGFADYALDMAVAEGGWPAARLARPVMGEAGGTVAWRSRPWPSQGLARIGRHPGGDVVEEGPDGLAPRRSCRELSVDDGLHQQRPTSRARLYFVYEASGPVCSAADEPRKRVG